jgi:hypothetical protein
MQAQKPRMKPMFFDIAIVATLLFRATVFTRLLARFRKESP